MTYAGMLLLFFAAPLALLYGKRHVQPIEKLGVVTLCYCTGLVAGNLPGVALDHALTTQILEIVVPLSIPLLLFSSNLRIWRSAGPSMLKSFGCGVVAVSIAVFASTQVFAGTLPEVSKLGGMMMGVYTGGTPNMTAIGMTLAVDHETFVVLNAADVIFGGLWLLCILSVGRNLIGRILKSDDAAASDMSFAIDEEFDLRGSSLGLVLSAAILGLSIGLSLLIVGRLHEMTILLALTTIGIASSGMQRIRELKGSFAAGNYLLLVFCVAVGSLANVSTIVETGPQILVFVGIIMGGAIALHLVFAYLLAIDPDTMIISSAAGIFGPAFIAPIARVIGKPQLIPVGLALSLLGFAIGNYLGLGMAHLLASR